MSTFDDLGNGLGSLSIDDLSGGLSARQDPIPLHPDADDMDIDSVSSEEADETYDLEEFCTLQGTKQAGRTEDDLQSPSLLGRYSPTSLGVLYALTPQKLLMGPETDNGHTVEFEDSAMDVCVAPPAFTENHFSKADSLPARTANAFSMSTGISPASFYGQLPWGLQNGHQYMGGVPAFPSTQVHHHHYYAGAPAGPAPQSPSSPLSKSVLTMDLLQNNEHERRDLALAKAQRLLPAPWDPQAVPAERVPYVLSSYLQLLVNTVLSGYMVHVLISVVQAVREDVSQQLEQQAQAVLMEMAQCERAWHENQCQPELVVPAMEKMCAEWERCMAQDPRRPGNRALVGARFLGAIVTALVEPLSGKVLLVFAFCTVVIYMCNFAFGYVRAKTYYGWAASRASTGSI